MLPKKSSLIGSTGIGTTEIAAACTPFKLAFLKVEASKFTEVVTWARRRAMVRDCRDRSTCARRKIAEIAEKAEEKRRALAGSPFRESNRRDGGEGDSSLDHSLERERSSGSSSEGRLNRASRWQSRNATARDIRNLHAEGIEAMDITFAHVSQQFGGRPQSAKDAWGRAPRVSGPGGGTEAIDHGPGSRVAIEASVLGHHLPDE